MEGYVICRRARVKEVQWSLDYEQITLHRYNKALEKGALKSKLSAIEQDCVSNV